MTNNDKCSAQKKEPKEKTPFWSYSSATPIGISAISMALFLIFLIIAAFNVEFLELPWGTLQTYALLGSFIGGTLGVAVASYALWVLFDTHTLQKREVPYLRGISAENLKIAKQSTLINERALSHQEIISKAELDNQNRKFQLEQIDKQLDRMSDELESLNRTVFHNTDPDRASVPAKHLFASPVKERPDSAYLESLSLNQVHAYVTQLSFHGFDAIRFLELGGQYHHRASQFDLLLALLKPFQEEFDKLVEFTKVLQLGKPDISLLAQTFIKLSELRGIQEEKIKQKLVSLYQ